MKVNQVELYKDWRKRMYGKRTTLSFYFFTSLLFYF